MKFKIAFLFLLILFFGQANVFAQTQTPALVVNFSVQRSETEVKVFIVNNTDDKPYRVATTFSDTNGYSKTQEGVVDPLGEEIIQTFKGLQAKHQYNVSVRGSPVTLNGGGFGPKTYTLKTVYGNPDIVETTGVGVGTTPIIPAPTDPAPPVPIVKPGSDNNSGNKTDNIVSNTNPNPTAGTIAGAGLTQEQIKSDKGGNGLVPCKDTCDFNDVMQLINNLITFLIVTLFAPIIIIMFMYAGYKYLTAGGNPSKIANIKTMVWNIFIGMLLVLCSWLIVKTILIIISSDEVGVTQFLK